MPRWPNSGERSIVSKLAFAVVISLLAGIALAMWFVGDELQETGLAGSGGDRVFQEARGLEDRLLQLEQVLAEERQARMALEDTLAQLFEDFERLEGAEGRAAAERRAEEQGQREARATEPAMLQIGAEWLRSYQEQRVGALVNGGFSEDEARSLLRQESEAAYKALQVAWEAQRNGEYVAPISTANNPQSILRAEIGDDAYARFLEAQGQPTSFAITQVMSGSPGNNVGIQAGDNIVSYNGERIFNGVELRERTLQGNPGEDVVIEIERNGTLMQLTIPRGPIGITGTGANLRSTYWWGG